MTNTLTFKLMGPGSATPAVRALPGARAPLSEGFGLVRQPAVHLAEVAHPADAAAANDLRASPDRRRDPGDDNLRAPMSPEQRNALHALTHARSPASGTRWARRDRGIDLVWAGTLAVLLALAASSIDSGRIFVATADRMHAAAEARTTTAQASQTVATRQSSVVTSRTM